MSVGIDAILIGVGVLALFLGFLSGFLKYIFLWGGAILGFILSPLISPLIVDLFSGTVGDKFLYGGIMVGICVAIGMIVGVTMGRAFNFLLPSFLKIFDRIAGAIMAFAIIGAMAWFILPLLESVGGTAEEWRKESNIAEFLDEQFPNPPNGRIKDAIEKVA